MEDLVDDKTLDQRLTDTLRETLSDLNERGEGVPEEPKAEPSAAPEASTSVDEPVKGEKARGPDGKFIKTETSESAAPAKANTLDSPKAAVAPAQAAAVPTELEAPLAGPSGQPIDLNRAPSSWKPAAKAAWMNLPPEVRSEIYRREGDFHVGNKPLKDNADFGQRIRTMTEPYRGMVEAEGGTLERSIENYFKTAATLRQGTPEQKLQMLFSIDQQFGGTLNQHFQRSLQAAIAQATGQPMQQGQQQVFQDPRVDTLMQRIEREDRERQSREQLATSQATERFLAAKDEKGQALYPFVDNVLDDMSDRVKGLRRANPELSHEEILKKAYEASVWANPETRDVLLKQQQAAAAAPVETLRKVEKAKAVVAGTMPKRGALPVTAPKGKFNSPEGDEAMLETLRQLTG